MPSAWDTLYHARPGEESRLRVYHNSIYASHPGARPYALVIFTDDLSLEQVIERVRQAADAVK